MGMDGFQGLSFQFDIKPPSSIGSSHGGMGYAPSYTQSIRPSPYPSHSYSGGNQYLASPQHLSTRSASWHGQQPVSLLPSTTRHSYSTHSLPTPQPLASNTPPTMTDDELNALLGIVSTDPPSSYQGFAEAPVVASNLSFIPPPPCNYYPSPPISDATPISGSAPISADLSSPEPTFYAPLLPTMDAPSSSPISGLSTNPWSSFAYSTLPVEPMPAVEQDWTQMLLNDSSSSSAGTGDTGVPGAVDNYLPLDLEGFNADGAFNEVWDQFEKENGGFSFVIPEAAGTW